MMVYSGHSNLKRVSTECGGKSPQLILDDAENIDAIAEQAIGIYENAGQVCSAGSRIYVHRSRYEEFVERFTAWTRDLFALGDPLDPEKTMGPLVNLEQQKRVLGYVETGIAEGARLAFGAGRPRRSRKAPSSNPPCSSTSSTRCGSPGRRSSDRSPPSCRSTTSGMLSRKRATASTDWPLRVDAGRQARPPVREGRRSRRRLAELLRQGRHDLAVGRIQAVGLRTRQRDGSALTVHTDEIRLARPAHPPG